MIFKELSGEYFNLGVNFTYGNNLTRAIEALKKAVIMDQCNWKALNVTGLCQYKKGDFLEARDTWRKSIQIYCGEENAALSYIKSFEDEDFINICDTYNMAVKAIEAGKLNKSIKLLLHKDFPCFEYCKFTNMLGLIYLDMGEELNAFLAFKRTLEIDCDNKDTKHYLEESWENLNIKISIGKRIKGWFVRR